MTKLRDPLSLGSAIEKIADALGWEAAAKVVGKSVRLIGYWSDNDDDREPKFSEALKLDAAYRAKMGSEDAPILAAYAYQLERAGLSSGIVPLAELACEAATEAGEALSALIKATRPGATFADKATAKRETTEAIDTLMRCEAALGAPLPHLRSVG